MSTASSTSTRLTLRFAPAWAKNSVLPISSLPIASASLGLFASLTAPALPRPPLCTCPLMTTRFPSVRATSRASSALLATCPAGTGTPYCFNNCFA